MKNKINREIERTIKKEGRVITIAIIGGGAGVYSHIY